MKLLFVIFTFLYVLKQTECIGGGSRSEGKRSLLPQSNNDGFSREIALEFRRLMTVQEKLNYLRKICKLGLKVSRENAGFGEKFADKTYLVDLFKYQKKKKKLRYSLESSVEYSYNFS